MRRARGTRVTAAVAALACALATSLPITGIARGARSAAHPVRSATWLLVSDIHLDPYARDARPSGYGRDGNRALLASTVAAMRSADPHPALVAIAGDLFAHHFARLAREHQPRSTPQTEGVRAMRIVERAFARAFPQAQFAIVPGNNDDPCGDYRSESGGAYNAAVARIWAPLVDRRGAAPGFERSYASLGSYTARLPGFDARLVAVNTVAFSSRFAGGCGGKRPRAAERELAWLRKTLRATVPGDRNVLLMHVPPGYDAFATEYTRGGIAWPMMQAFANRAFVTAIAAPADRVLFALAGHTHRFDLRLAGGVPIVIAGAISPIYGNNPNFAVLRVDADGIRDLTLHFFDEVSGRWLRAPSFDRTWQVARIDAAGIGRIHRRLGREASVRRGWDRQSSGWPSELEPLWGAQWRVAWCAQTELDAQFAQCAGVAARQRWVLGGAVALGALALVAIVLIVRRRANAERRSRARAPGNRRPRRSSDPWNSQ